jgi:hypothetical protein
MRLRGASMKADKGRRKSTNDKILFTKNGKSLSGIEALWDFGNPPNFGWMSGLIRALWRFLVGLRVCMLESVQPYIYL